MLFFLSPIFFFSLWSVGNFNKMSCVLLPSYNFFFLQYFPNVFPLDFFFLPFS